MQVLAVLVLLSVSVAICSATYGNYYYEGRPCQPSYPEVCQEKTLVRTETTPADGYGVNVCKTTYYYEKKVYSYAYKKVCRYYWHWWHYRYHCSWHCTKTDNCDRIITKTDVSYHCCEGYTTSLAHSHYTDTYYYKWILRYYGCPRVVIPTITDCIDKLGLTQLAWFLNGTGVSQRLNSTSEQFTLLAPSDSAFNLTDIKANFIGDEEQLLSFHVLDKEVIAKKFRQGQALQTILDGYYVHVTVIPGTDYSAPGTTGIFINGARVEIEDACFAENGVVHVINSFIESSNETITDIVSVTEELSIFSKLLVKSGIAALLDQPRRLRSLLAPTNSAFLSLQSKLQLDIVACLKDDSKSSVLNKFVTYHVLDDVEFSSTLILRDQVETKACYKAYCYFYRCVYRCKKIEVGIGNNGIVLGPDDSEIEMIDIPAVNGVIHHLSYPIVNPWLNLTSECDGFPLGSILVPPGPLVPPPPTDE